MSRFGIRPTGFIRLAVAGLFAMALALGLTISSQPAAEAKTSSYVTSKYQPAKYGQDNQRVTNIQLRLAAGGFLKSKSVTGYYGDVTRNAIKSFRRSIGLRPTNGKRVDKPTWKALVKATGRVKKKSANSGSGTSTKSSKIDKRCLTGGRVLCVNETTSQLYYINHNKVIQKMDARFGCGGSTREGTFTVFRKVRNDWSREYGSPMPLSMYFSGGEAVHYSADFAARGYAGCSHGCVNIRDRHTLKWVYDRIKVGDRVVVYFS